MIKRANERLRARFSRFIISGVALAMVFSGLVVSGAVGSAASAAAKKSPLTIAISAPFTGGTADYGLEISRALTLAEKYYGSSVNGHPDQGHKV